MWEILLDILVLGLFDWFFSLFGSNNNYKFIVSNYKNGNKFRIRSIYSEKKKKYKIRIEQLVDNKYNKIQSGVFSDESIIDDFQSKHTKSGGFTFSEYKWDHLGPGSIKFNLDSIGWYKTK